jgi:hypothetical protein
LLDAYRSDRGTVIGPLSNQPLSSVSLENDQVE